MYDSILIESKKHKKLSGGNMNEVLRKKAKRSLLTLIIICTVLIAVGLVITKCSFIDLIKGPIDITESANWTMDELEDLEGKYVTIDVDNPLGCYAEEYSKNTKTGVEITTSLCYACLLVDEETSNGYIYGIMVEKGRAEDFEEVFTNYKEGNTYRITGTFKKMSSEMLNYYERSIKDYYGQEGWDYSIPYYIYDQTIGGVDYFLTYFIYAVSVILIIFMIINVIRFFSDRHMRYIKRYLAKNDRESMQGIEAEFLSSNVISKHYRLGRKYFFYSKGSTMSLLPLSKQVWAYYYKRTGKNSVSQLRFYDVDKKETNVNIDENTAHVVLQQLLQQCPHIVIGYDAGLMNTYKRDFNAFLNMKYNVQREAAGTQDNNWNLDVGVKHF